MQRGHFPVGKCPFWDSRTASVGANLSRCESYIARPLGNTERKIIRGTINPSPTGADAVRSCLCALRVRQRSAEGGAPYKCGRSFGTCQTRGVSSALALQFSLKSECFFLKVSVLLSSESKRTPRASPHHLLHKYSHIRFASSIPRGACQSHCAATSARHSAHRRR